MSKFNGKAKRGRYKVGSKAGWHSRPSDVRMVVDGGYSVVAEYKAPERPSAKWDEAAYRSMTREQLLAEAEATMLRIASGEQGVDYYK